MKHPIYQLALDVQDAGNLTGIIASLAEVAQVVREEMEERGESTATENVNRHPAMVLIIHKLAELCGIPNQYANDALLHYQQAYDTCKERANA
jgi:hypothetical protein